ncbi:MAG TPA: acylneuraminate cytidylyltransferase [Sediminispirochaeta sp.]|nr:acylneuraminate cytidylyltransferase [Sediminispirochaeta sp.]
MSRVGVFLQVRLDSQRLPEKALLPLAGRPVITHAMESLRRLEVDVHALLTDLASSDALAPLAKEWGFQLFVGPKEDVLERFAHAAEYFRLEHIIRATGDNPLVDGECARLIMEEHLEQGADYSAFHGLPLGAGVECVGRTALEVARKETAGEGKKNLYYREHVCPYLYDNPDRFRIHRPPAPSACQAPELRLTLDTADDYQHLKRIFRELYVGNPLSTRRIVSAMQQQIPSTG